MSGLVNDAFIFALEAHKGQVRKDGKPYISHPFAVAMELAQNGAEPTLIAAGLLHDTIEDADVTLEEIGSKFGDEVLSLVQFDTEDKSCCWKERKTKTLNDLKNCDRKYMMLICADKLANIRDIEEDIRKNGDSIWGQFKVSKDEQEWLYREYCTMFERISDLKMYEDFKNVIETVF